MEQEGRGLLDKKLQLQGSLGMLRVPPQGPERLDVEPNGNMY